MPSFQVICRTTSIEQCRLVVSTSSDLSSPSYGALVSASDSRIRMVSPDLSSGAYYWGVERDGILLASPRGQSKIPSASHTIAWSSCAETGSTHAVFSQIESENPDAFFHLGDMHYRDNTSAEVATYLSDLELVFQSGPQASLYRNVPTFWMVDDHDAGGGNDHAGNTDAARAAAEAWRIMAPHPTLLDTAADGGRYFSYDIGRVRYVVTDQRRFASVRTTTDDASKTVLGATQKAWFKDIIQNSPGMLIVWCCTRAWHYPVTSSSDTWGGFSTERTELADHIQAHAPERVDILVGDRHYGALDDGANCNYTTGGVGNGLICAVASPLDKDPSSNDAATFSGGYARVRGIYGRYEVVDTGGDTITRNIAIKNSSGTDLITLSKSTVIGVGGDYVDPFASDVILDVDFNSNYFDKSPVAWKMQAQGQVEWDTVAPVRGAGSFLANGEGRLLAADGDNNLWHFVDGSDANIPFTVEFEMQARSDLGTVGTDDGLLCAGGTAGNSRWVFYLHSDGHLSIFAAGNILHLEYTGNLNDGNPHHVAWVRDSSDVCSLYVDRVRVDQVTDSHNYSTGNGEPLYIGADIASIPARIWDNGLIDAVKITTDARYSGASFPDTELQHLDTDQSQLDPAVQTATRAPWYFTQLTNLEHHQGHTRNPVTSNYILVNTGTSFYHLDSDGSTVLSTYTTPLSDSGVPGSVNPTDPCHHKGEMVMCWNGYYTFWAADGMSYLRKFASPNVGSTLSVGPSANSLYYMLFDDSTFIQEVSDVDGSIISTLSLTGEPITRVQGLAWSANENGWYVTSDADSTIRFISLTGVVSAPLHIYPYDGLQGIAVLGDDVTFTNYVASGSFGEGLQIVTKAT